MRHLFYHCLFLVSPSFGDCSIFLVSSLIILYAVCHGLFALPLCRVFSDSHFGSFYPQNLVRDS